ncbi:MAG TPA: hypothetical protein VEK08_00040 [Planctomycetota bacterium]|nr:hypothetical protein [Planctomycetota bacterium]
MPFRAFLRSIPKQVLLLALGGALVTAGCIHAPFLTYDDPAHVGEALKPDTRIGDLIRPVADLSYIPVTLLSYRLDYILFNSWLTPLMGSLAPGCRFMTYLYHLGAAIVLWRVMLGLRFSRLQSLFIALFFVAHPLACETVCWVSERKNALAALFSFLALWAQLRLSGQFVKRMLAVSVLYSLALISKPSALGILPVLLLLEVFPSVLRRVPLASEPWPRRALPVLVFGLVSWGVIVLNVSLVKHMIIPPPGGSLFTAILTDLEILSRYLLNLALPLWLSAVYLVNDVKSVADPRVVYYGALLLALFGGSLMLARRPRRVLFGWFWLVAALGPNLNLVGISHVMQDRYIYLSTPGFAIILSELLFSAGPRMENSGRLRVAVASILLLFNAALAGVRSQTWESTRTVFADAVAKQPRAALARFGLGSAYGEMMQKAQAAGDTKNAVLFQRAWIEQWQKGVDECPDRFRYSAYIEMALNVAGDRLRNKKLDYAKRYFELAAHPPASVPDIGDARAEALSWLAWIAFERGNTVEAYEKAQQAVRVSGGVAGGRLMRARAAMKLAEEKRENRKELLREAADDLRSIKPESELYNDAQALLKLLSEK